MLRILRNKKVLLVITALLLMCMCMPAVAEGGCEDGKHTLVKTVKTPATCTVDGVMDVKCTTCGLSYTEAIIHAGHKEGSDYHVINAATCTQDGLKVKKCTVCGERISGSEAVIPATGHEFEWKLDKEPTCIATGFRRQVCKKCNYENATETVPMVAHKWGEWKTTKASTCTEKGTTERTCSVCSAKETGELPLAEHKKAADWTVKTQPTCVLKGVKVKICTVCHADLEYGEIDALGHVTGYKQTKAPTCTAKGAQDQICTRCNIVLKADIEIAALGHTWGEWKTVKAPTCTEKGSEERTCGRCQAKETRELALVDHTYGPWTQVKAPTCTEKGEEKSICSVCKAEVSRTIPALGHTWGPWTQVKAPTCTEKGMEKRICSVCKAEEERDVAALGHKWTPWSATKLPTCTEKGEAQRTCPVCSKVEKQEIPALGHEWGEWKVNKAPTCTEPGEREHTCKICGKVEKEVIPPTNHANSKWVVIEKATITSPGVKVLICNDCGKEVDRKVIPVLTLNNNTMCAFGPRLRDVELKGDHDLWYMFTPFDASQDGEYTYELVASNMYIVGELTITVEGDVITVDYKLNSNKITVDFEFFTILNEIHDISGYEPEELDSRYGMRLKEEISIMDDLGGDTNLVLYFCSRVTYKYDSANMTGLNYESRAHQEILDEMMEIMD